MDALKYIKNRFKKYFRILLLYSILKKPSAYKRTFHINILKLNLIKALIENKWIRIIIYYIIENLIFTLSIKIFLIIFRSEDSLIIYKILFIKKSKSFSFNYFNNLSFNLKYLIIIYPIILFYIFS